MLSKVGRILKVHRRVVRRFNVYSDRSLPVAAENEPFIPRPWANMTGQSFGPWQSQVQQQQQSAATAQQFATHANQKQQSYDEAPDIETQIDDAIARR